MRTFGVASEGNTDFPLLEIQHPNFVDICEAYLFKSDIAVIVEYVGFSIEDLLQRSIYPTEREIAYVISQASLSLPYLNLSSILTLQALAGIRFVWTRELAHPRISTDNILVSLRGEVKIGKAPKTLDLLQS